MGAFDKAGMTGLDVDAGGGSGPAAESDVTRWLLRLSSALVVLGVALCFLTLSYEYFGAWTGAGIGRKQIAVLVAGGAATLAGAGLRLYAAPDERADTLRFWAVAAQVVLLAAVFHRYQLENRAFFELVFPAIAAGFIVHHQLPAAWRKPFFFLLALACYFGVFAASDPVSGLWLIGSALALFLIADLPIPLLARIGVLVAAGVGFAAIRVGWIESEHGAVILPILCSMFIFRLAIYLYDRENGKGPTNIWQRLSYFFLPPNVVFPFFPVVDFATFGRTYYNQDACRIYQRGAMFLLYGLVHLLIYRLVYLRGVIAPEAVESAGDFARFITMNFGLYLRISGMFHLIAGTILLFGYNLPETHARFYFANGFIDFWRRINIYWKDFMQKMVFNPAFVRIHRAGAPQLAAIVASMFAVFFATWALHAYQWFWLRGTTLLTIPDMAFWGGLACFLAFQTVYEQRMKSAGDPGRSLLGPQASLVLRTACTFITICLMWSLWTSASLAAWGRMWVSSGLMPAFGPGGAGALAWMQTSASLVAAAFVVGVTAGVRFGVVSPPSGARSRAKATSNPHFRGLAAGAAVCLALMAAQAPTFRAGVGAGTQELLSDLRVPQLNAQDQALLRRGYYEDLTNIGQLNSRLWELYTTRPRASSDIRDTNFVRQRDDVVNYEFRPSSSGSAHGVTYAINSWGMREPEIALAKPAGVMRIALAGASPVVGWGVEVDERFDTLLAAALDADSDGGGARHQTLNFAVDGYQVVDRVVTFDEKGWSFEPDLLLYFAHSNEWDMDHLAKRYAQTPWPEAWFLSDALVRAGLAPGMGAGEIERRLRAARADIVATAYRHLAAQAREHSVTPVWVYMPLVGENPADSEEATLAQLAREAGFAVIELGGVYDGYEPAAVQLAPWDSHPNPFGHELLAARLEQRLRELESEGEVELSPRR